MQCPVCHVDLLMSEKHGVEIDYCPKCRGVWLDRGEIEEIVRRSNQSSYAPPSTHQTHVQYDDNHNDHYRHPKHDEHRHHKKESFLGDLFDF